MKSTRYAVIGLFMAVLSACGTSPEPSVEPSANASNGTAPLKLLNSPEDIGKLTGNFTVDLTPQEAAKMQAQGSLTFPPIVPALLPQPCANHISAPVNSHGYIIFQQGTTGTERSVQWGFYMYKQYRPLYTFWKTRTTLNNTNLGELNKTYEPHGSIPSYSLKIGHIVYIQGIATGPNSYTYLQGACKVTY